MRVPYHTILIAVVFAAAPTVVTAEPTVVEISGENFLINGQATYSDIPTCPVSMHGLLFNVRSVNATFDDLELGAGGLPAGFLDDAGNHANNNFAGYGPWDPDANTDRFIAALPSWRDKGVLAVTLNFQGGCSCTRNGEQGVTLAGDYQTPNNNPYGPNGTPIDPDYLDRMARCINALDELDMVCILGLFYFGQDQRVSNANDSQAVKDAVDAVVDWVIANDWRNVIIEINNETTVGAYQHDILSPSRVHELFQRVKTRSVRDDGTRLLVSASSTGTSLPPDSWMLEADFFLPHGNGLNATQISQLVADYRANARWQANPRPICFNEDSTNIANLDAAAAGHASWGFYNDPHIQSVYPANWTIWSPIDIAFFNRVAELVGLNGSVEGEKVWIPAATWPNKTFQGAMTSGAQYTTDTSMPPDADADEDSLIGQCIFVNSDTDEGSDSVIYTVNLPTAGIWYAWGRFYYPGAPGGNDPNSFYISVDGGAEYKFGNNRFEEPSFREWHWDGDGNAESGVKNQPLGQLSAGLHQIKIRNRESDTTIGPRLDMLLLTTASLYVPTDADAQAGLGPSIVLSPASISRTVFIHDALDDSSFTVANGGIDTLDYAITDDADWLDVDPAEGSSTGEADAITVSFDVAELNAGEIDATITVSDPAATNDPQTLPVTVVIESVEPDLDGDGDVDLEDFGLFQACLSGTGVAQNDEDCQDARFDTDADVDEADFMIFEGCMSGANIAAERTCAD